MLLRAYPNIYYRTFIHHSGRTDFFPPAFVRKPRQSAAIPAFSFAPDTKIFWFGGVLITSSASLFLVEGWVQDWNKRTGEPEGPQEGRNGFEQAKVKVPLAKGGRTAGPGGFGVIASAARQSLRGLAWDLNRSRGENRRARRRASGSFLLGNRKMKTSQGCC